MSVTITNGNKVIVKSSGTPGPAGADGVGVPAGGTAGQTLQKIDNTDYNTQWSNAGSGDVIAANNLSDLASSTTALTNLGFTATITELNFMDGVTAAVQTQLDAKQATVTGAVSTVVGSDLTGSRVVVSNVVGKIAASPVTTTELNYLDGVTSAIQTQLDAKQPLATVLTNTTASFTTAQETKLGHISVTQAVDLDTMETRLNELDAAVVLQGSWDASSGSFPGSGSAQAGHSYIVSTGGTVDGQVFVANDRIVAIVDNASTSTYASNWLKLDYSDNVLSVAGKTGAVTLAAADIASGTFADARISESSVTQHQSALSIAASQVTGTKTNTFISDFNTAADARITAAIGSTVQAYDADTAKTDTAQEYTATQNFNMTTLTDSATVSWNLAANQVAELTLAGNRTLAAPTNQVAGATYILIVKQDATGSRTLTFNSAYKFPGGTAPTLTTTASAVDVITFVSDGTNMYGVSQLDFS